MAEGFAELKCLKGFGYSCGLDRYGRQCLEVLGRRSRGRNPSATKFMVEDHDPVHQIAQNRHQLGVVALLKVCPGEVVVFGLGHRSG